jgi:hypothetical protein
LLRQGQSPAGRYLRRHWQFDTMLGTILAATKNKKEHDYDWPDENALVHSYVFLYKPIIINDFPAYITKSKNYIISTDTIFLQIVPCQVPVIQSCCQRILVYYHIASKTTKTNSICSPFFGPVFSRAFFTSCALYRRYTETSRKHAFSEGENEYLRVTGGGGIRYWLLDIYPSSVLSPWSSVLHFLLF